MGIYRRANKSPPAYRRTSAYIACLIPLLLGSAPGHTHQNYDPWCCNTRDCGPYPKAEVQPVPGGWMVKPTPEADAIFFKEEAYRVSEDGRTHLCIYHGQARCLYLAPRS
ncbi:MAG TPA: hypothetical protein VD994_10590 [Prosthecobacter sp.]|nr:hypothetical protein [Prosthecobacter sp.]